MNQEVKLYVAGAQVPGQVDAHRHRAQIKVGPHVVWESDPLNVTEPEARAIAMSRARDVITRLFSFMVER